ncbi:MAG: 4Fe-4S binding protein [Desulfobacteraceae bacterium]|nr:4Fe-4S binding protein [Desulfobacteraceae bacterium]
MENIYEKLRARLDDLANGYPATESKVEIRLLERLFTEEEAELYMQLSPFLEKPKDVAKRLNRDVAELEPMMERMAQKGHLFRMRKGDMVRYSVVPYVVGIFEHQLGRMDEGFARDHEEYFETAFGKTIQAFKTPILRTIPIKRQLVADYPVAPFEDVLQIIESQKKIAVAPCVCRTTKKMVGHECDKPVENCFSFGSHAEYYVENGMGRFITIDEAKEIVTRNEEAGLVMQPFNSQKIGGMCSCCGDCCGVLRSLKMHPAPAQMVQSNYFARVDEEECTGCETCLERCQMDAIDVVDGIAGIELERCIGCGLCVTTCPVDAIDLVKKPEDQLYEPPKSGAETYMKIMQERGKL